ncbi:hypothetical protein CDL12_11821 [Handroanthus impetiginosus]|uniref:S-protein homolog n=1 Tax=Handroanthus impetiginosus TaxID=429701 RepID=A0A2G9HDC9_9LAMI|nr:hypothetical protein CDL12_11821 [Handroanthus impetiginosus]
MSNPSKTLLLLIVFTNAFIPLIFSVSIFDCKIIVTNTSQNKTLTPNLPHTHEEKYLSYCLMKLGHKHGDFIVFDWDRDHSRCANKICEWHINEDVLSLLIKNILVLQFRWPIGNYVL